MELFRGKVIARITLNILAVLLLVLIGTISLQVVCSALSINPLLVLTDSLPFFGKAVTLNSLLDFQWHLLVILGLIPAGLVWLRDKHVRVDFFYTKRSATGRSIVDLAGNLVFALPFLWLIIHSSIDFAHRALRSDEGSRNNGLEDLWIIKSVLPLGMTLLALAVFVETIVILRNLTRSSK